MSAQRKALIEHMTLRGLSPKTIEAYVHWMSRLDRFAGKRVHKVTRKDVRAFLVHLITEKRLAYSSINQARWAIQYFFTHIVKRKWVTAELPPMKKGFSLPVVLGPHEIARIIECLSNPRSRMLVATAYAAGLRVSEVVSLRVQDIQAERKMLFIKSAKGKKDRYVPLSPRLLEELRSYYRTCLSWQGKGNETPWLFPSPKDPQKHIDPATAQRAFKKARAAAVVHREAGFHCLRHSYATHSLELGVDIKTLQQRLGHRYLQSTLIYLHVARVPFRELLSPYDSLPKKGSKENPEDRSQTDKKEAQDRQE